MRPGDVGICQRIVSPTSSLLSPPRTQVLLVLCADDDTLDATQHTLPVSRPPYHRCLSDAPGLQTSRTLDDNCQFDMALALTNETRVAAQVAPQNLHLEQVPVRGVGAYLV
ncbi:hypothetical protein R3P38DRAFT_3173805 [Favolaschia claudopus]|uniref:Uncharacterized protein n=1 Tax=Favolaschia claudopus TaxID=2862362 RepID=A0AAW0DCL9_9AGAR